MRLIDLDSDYIQETLYRRGFKTRQDIEEWLNSAPVVDSIPIDNYNQIPLPYIKVYRKALRDVVDWLERHEQQMKAYKLTTGKDYMAFLRMLRDAPDSLMEMGGFADGYRVPDKCKDKVKKAIEKRREQLNK